MNEVKEKADQVIETTKEVIETVEEVIETVSVEVKKAHGIMSRLLACFKA
jgi:hypothetical protein